MFDMRSSQVLTSPSDGNAAGDGGGGDRETPSSIGVDASRRPTRTSGTASQVMTTQAAAGDIGRFADTVHRLQQRVGDLHALQLGQEEALGQLAARIDALATGAASSPDQTTAEQLRDDAAAARHDALAETIAALQAETALLSDQVTELAERARDGSGPSAADIDGLLQRLGAAEKGLATLQARGGGTSNVAQVSADLERRIEAVEQALEGRLGSVRAEFLQRQAEGQTRNDRRLRQLGLALGLPIGLLILLLPVLFGAAWWHADQRFAITDVRLEALSERVPASPSQDAEAGSLMAPALEQLEQIQSTLAAMQEPAERAPAPAMAEQPEVIGEPDPAPAIDPAAGLETSAVEPNQTPDTDDLAPSDAAATLLEEQSQRSPRVLTEPEWMIQLIGFQSLESAVEFATRYGLAERAWTLTGRWRGGPWYSVLIEPHADRARAMAAFEALPSELRALDPMVRRLETGTRLEPIDSVTGQEPL